MCAQFSEPPSDLESLSDEAISDADDDDDDDDDDEQPAMLPSHQRPRLSIKRKSVQPRTRRPRTPRAARTHGVHPQSMYRVRLAALRLD